MMTEKQLRILIADDQPYMRRAVKALLESRDGWVVCGEAADGLEAARRIHREFPDSHILILTLHDVPELVRLVQTAGAQGLVLKSDSNRMLISAVEHLGSSDTFYSYTN